MDTEMQISKTDNVSRQINENGIDYKFHDRNHKYGITRRIDFNGNITYKKDDEIHRETKPAIIWPYDKFYWWKNGIWYKNLRDGIFDSNGAASYVTLNP